MLKQCLNNYVHSARKMCRMHVVIFLKDSFRNALYNVNLRYTSASLTLFLLDAHHANRIAVFIACPAFSVYLLMLIFVIRLFLFLNYYLLCVSKYAELDN